jgi:hypothetical protein
LGVRISLKGEFTAEKQHVLKTMQERVQALRKDQWLTPTLKELAVKIGKFHSSDIVQAWFPGQLAIASQWDNSIIFCI